MTTNPFHGKVTELGNNLGTNLCVTWCVGRLDIDCHLRVAAVLHDDGDIARCVLTFHMLPQHTASQRAFRFRTLVPRRSVVACRWRILRLQREEPTRLRGGAFGIFGSGYDWRFGLPRLSPPTQKVVARSMKLQVDKWTSVCVVKPLAEATLSR
jgi:hypothetical protein